MNKFSYTTRITLAFALVALMTVLVAIGILSFVWDQHFQSYTRENMETTAVNTATRIGERYAETHSWNQETTSAAAYVTVMYPGIGIMVLDTEGNVHFDSMASAGAGNSTMLAPSDTTDIVESAIVSEGQVIGTVKIWAYGSDSLLRQTDRAFRDNSYQAMLLASVLAVVLASLVGLFFARSLVRPINRMTKTARAIKEGDMSARTGLVGEDEISSLGSTFDEMASAIEKNLDNERRLTADVAHELRTPLMAIRATVEAMIDGVFEADEEHLLVVNEEVQRLNRMVNELLELARLESGAISVKHEIMDVSECVADVVAMHEALIADSGLELMFHADKNVIIKGDADRIRQATANLLFNAVRYTPEGGRIGVSVTKGEIMASISVEDTGIGLSPEEAKMVFNRFWRADEGRARSSGGLGIGLSIVKEIVDKHGGWVQVEGQKGRGARFTIHIPLYDEERELERAQEASKTAQKAQRAQQKKEKELQKKQQQQEKQRARRAERRQREHEKNQKRGK